MNNETTEDNDFTISNGALVIANVRVDDHYKFSHQYCARLKVSEHSLMPGRISVPVVATVPPVAITEIVFGRTIVAATVASSRTTSTWRRRDACRRRTGQRRRRHLSLLPLLSELLDHLAKLVISEMHLPRTVLARLNAV